MRGIGRGGDGVEFAPRVAEIQLRIRDLRQRGVPARVAVEELLLHLDRPADQAQQLDPAHRLDHARVERGVVGDVGGESGSWIRD